MTRRSELSAAPPRRILAGSEAVDLGGFGGSVSLSKQHGYQSKGGIGVPPMVCSTVPVEGRGSRDDEVRAKRCPATPRGRGESVPARSISALSLIESHPAPCAEQAAAFEPLPTGLRVSVSQR